MRIIIVGAGEVGRYLAQILVSEDHELVVVDSRETALAEIAELFDVQTLLGSGAAKSVLEKAGAPNADLILCVTNNDEVNMLACGMARHLGTRQAVARVSDDDYLEDNAEDYLTAFRLDLVISPERLTVQEIRKLLMNPGAAAVEDFALGRIQMMQFSLTGESKRHRRLFRQPLHELKIPQRTLIALIGRGDDVVVPRGSDILQEGDRLFVLGAREKMSEVEHMFGEHARRARKVCLVGGGSVSYMLAQNLESSGIQVKILEPDRARCKWLSERLGKTEVINGRGTDPHLLKEQRIEANDAVICLSGEDEENLMASLLAREMKVERTIVVLQKPDYVPILDRLGASAAISPRLVTAKHILSFIKRGSHSTIALLEEGQAEIMEVVLGSNTQIAGRPLKEAKLPKGSLVGAAMRGNEVFVPSGDSVLEPGDIVIFFALTQSVEALEERLRG